MKKLFVLMFTWFCFQTMTMEDVCKKLNKLPKGTEVRIFSGVNGMGPFTVFYNAEQQVK